MSVTANEIIKAALRRLVVIPSGGTPTANQYADGLEVLNDLLASWSSQINLVYEDTMEEISVSSGTQNFKVPEVAGVNNAVATNFLIDVTASFTSDVSVGNIVYNVTDGTAAVVTSVSSDVVIQIDNNIFTSTGKEYRIGSIRPLQIISASLKTGNNEYPLKIINNNKYQNIFDKSIVGLPTELYYRSTYPTGTIYFNTTTDQAYTLILNTVKKLDTFANGTTYYHLPDYYERALKLNLALELAPEMGAANRITSLLVNQAQEAKDAIIGLAVDIDESSISSIGGRYSIESDSY